MLPQILAGILFVFVLASCTATTPLPNPTILIKPIELFDARLDAVTAHQPDRFLIQAQRVKGVLQAALGSGTKFINQWGGFPDELGWLGPQADATPWTDTWQEKPMYFVAESVLFKNYLQDNQIDR